MVNYFKFHCFFLCIILTSLDFQVNCQQTVKYMLKIQHLDKEGHELPNRESIVTTGEEVKMKCQLKIEAGQDMEPADWPKVVKRTGIGEENSYFEMSLYYMKDATDDKNEVMRMKYNCLTNGTKDKQCEITIVHLTQNSPIKATNFKVNFYWESKDLKSTTLSVILTILDIQQNQDGFYECNKYDTGIDTDPSTSILSKPVEDDIHIKEMIQLVVQETPNVVSLTLKKEWVENDTVLVICTYEAGNPPGTVTMFIDDTQLEHYSLPHIRTDTKVQRRRVASFTAERKHDKKKAKCSVKSDIGYKSLDHQIIVFYRPTAVTHTSYQYVFNRKDKIVCNAQGNPKLSYQWIKMVSSHGELTVQDEQTLYVSELAPYGWYHYMCIVSNTIRGKIFQHRYSIKFLVAPSQNKQADSSKVPMLMTILVFISTWALIWRRFRTE